MFFHASIAFKCFLAVSFSMNHVPLQLCLWFCFRMAQKKRKKESIPSCKSLPSSEEMVYTGEIAVHKSARSWGRRSTGSQFGNENLWILYIGIGLSLRKPRSQAFPTSSFCSMQNWRWERSGNEASVVRNFANHTLRRVWLARLRKVSADLVGSAAQCHRVSVPRHRDCRELQRLASLCIYPLIL